MQNPSTPFSAAERLICKLRDVASCDIQVAPNGVISAIHVTARAGRSPKQIARDIESVLAAEEGVQIDHRKISIAQYGETETSPDRRIGRLAIQGISLHQAAHGFEAEVTLGTADLQATGRALGAASRYDVHRVVARATLDAIANLVESAPPLSLGEIEEMDLGRRRVMVVCVNRIDGRHETALIGSCEVGYDPTRAVITALLDAVNRLLGSLDRRDPVEYEVGPAPPEG